MRQSINLACASLLGACILLGFGCDREEFPADTPIRKNVPSTGQGTSTAPADAGAISTSVSVQAIQNRIASWPPPAPAGEEAAIADNLFAVNYYVVLDGSGSMTGSNCSGGKSKTVVAKEALVEFASVVPANANLGLAVFDERGSVVEERVPLGIGNRDVFIQKVNESKTDSGTPLHNAVVRGYKALVAQARRQLGYGEYILVIVTDGEPDAGQDPQSAVKNIVENSPVVVTTIGFCIGKNHALNQPGKTVYKEANNPAEVRAGLAAVLAESAEFSRVPVK